MRRAGGRRADCSRRSMPRKTEFVVSLLVDEDATVQHIEERVRTAAGYRRAGELAVERARKSRPGVRVSLFGPSLRPAVRKAGEEKYGRIALKKTSKPG